MFYDENYQCGGANGNGAPRDTGGGGSGGGTSPAGPPGGGKGIFDHPVPEGHAKTMSAVLGEKSLMANPTRFRRAGRMRRLDFRSRMARRGGDKRNKLMTPVLLQQFRLFYAKDRPLGVVFWAFVDDEVEKRLAEGTTKLRPQD